MNEQCDRPDFWDTPKTAQALIKERNYYAKAVESIENIESALKEVEEYAKLAQEEGEDLEGDVLNELSILYNKTKLQEVECLFSGEADGNDCFLEIHSGAGGTESDDWASMLLRMYQRYAEKSGFRVEIIDILNGEEAGIKSATLKISGQNAYGWLKTESGVHRLVRISPFNAAGERHTSFSSVWVYPVVDDTIDIEINPIDLRIDTYRSSGAGGQHVNTTDSAVRITHMPSGIVVQSQNNRSQHKNKDECMKMLKSRLYNLELEKRQEEANKSNAKKLRLAGGIRFVHMFCIHIKWLKI